MLYGLSSDPLLLPRLICVASPQSDHSAMADAVSSVGFVVATVLFVLSLFLLRNRPSSSESPPLSAAPPVSFKEPTRSRSQSPLGNESEVDSIRWIDRSELVLKGPIGEGGYGNVGEYEWEGRRVAAKTLFYEGREILEREAKLLHKVQPHPNVLEFMGCTFEDEDQKQGMLVMELMSGDLESLMKKRRKERPAGAAPFSLKVAVDMMRQIANGLQHLRHKRVLHRDLKSLNILVNPRQRGKDVEGSDDHESYYDVKISDFGRSKWRDEGDSVFSSVVAPPSWRAPEVFRDKDMASSKYTWPSDVYSFGMVCYEILTGEIPFADFQVQHPKAKDLHTHICAGERPELPTHCPQDLYKLIHECWARNPAERPAISVVYQRLLAIDV